MKWLEPRGSWLLSATGELPEGLRVTLLWLLTVSAFAAGLRSLSLATRTLVVSALHLAFLFVLYEVARQALAALDTLGDPILSQVYAWTMRQLTSVILSTPSP